MEKKQMKILMVIVPLVIALLSIFVVSKYTSSVSFHAKTIAALDEKKETVLQLTAVSTGASAAITLVPGDVATPIAEKLADLSSYFIIVLCAIYLEKYLLTITGFAAFVILIPLGCLLLSIHAVLPRPTLMELAKKLIMFGIAIVLVIPSSVGVSNMIEKTYSESIDLTMQQALETTESIREDIEGATNAADQSTAEDAVGDSGTGSTADRAEDESGQTLGEIWQGIVSNASETVTSTVQGALDSTVNGVETKINEFKDMLNHMLEALAVMIVTSCLIPIIVLVFFVWLIKVILNVTVPMPPMGRPGGMGHRPI